MSRISNLRTVSFKTLNMCMAVIAVCATVFLFYLAFRTSYYLNSLGETYGNYQGSEHPAEKMMMGSDYLTEQVSFYVITGEKTYVDNYFTEAKETKQREIALASLKPSMTHSNAYSRLQRSFERSMSLMDREYHAMRLMLEAFEEDLSAYPDELRKYALDASEMRLSADEKKERARQLVFSREYRAAKARIRSDAYASLQLLSAEREDTLKKSLEMQKRLIRFQYATAGLLMLVVFLFISAVSLLIIRPLSRNADRMRSQKELIESGAYEVKYFASTYNKIFRQNRENHRKLSYEAEHDALTGLYNRSSFEKLRETHEKRSIALLLIDVDKFKSINDTYGHSVGDRILKKVSHMLKYTFREEDFVFRIGGDEFAVIMVYARSELQPVIERKIRECNSELGRPSDGLPPVSLSVGVAFSDSENKTGDLYKNADSALYVVKEHGRNGIAFYGADKPSSLGA